jgi:predicted lipoprotein
MGEARGRRVRAPLSETLMRGFGWAAVLISCLGLASCEFIKTSEVAARAQAGAGGAAAAFDPDKMVSDIWATKVTPYFERKAGPFIEVRALAAKAPDEAGAKYGFRSKADGTPWTLMVRIEGTVVASDTESRAATIGVDVDGDGKSDATVQIGPAMRGTAIRDALSFVSFNDFTNQIDFARFGKSFNLHVDRTTLQKLPRDNLAGRKVSVLGAYQLGGGDPPLVTPVEISLGPKP